MEIFDKDKPDHYHQAGSWAEPMKIEPTEQGVRILSKCDECNTKIWEYYNKVREIDGC